MSRSALTRDCIAGVILAGGQARRMGGGDKALLPLAGRSLLSHVIERVRPQVGGLVLNANGDPDRFAAYPLPVVADPLPDYPGPLAGLLAAMLWARAAMPDATHVATFAADTPFVPRILVAALADGLAATENAEIAVAEWHGDVQPVFALIPIALASRLEADLRSGMARRVLQWLMQSPTVIVPVATDQGTDPFFNINTPADLQSAESWAARGGGP